MASRRFPEHDLQVMIRKFVAEAVKGDHLFIAFDRSRKQSPMQHMFEKARGLLKGTPDTILLTPNLPAIWVEIKAPGKTVSSLSYEQHLMGDTIKRCGHVWFWANSVVGYGQQLKAAGVPLVPWWPELAEKRDGILAAGAVKSLAKDKPVAKRAPVKKAAAGRLRKTAKIRAEGLF